jgi:MFS family permease
VSDPTVAADSLVIDKPAAAHRSTFRSLRNHNFRLFFVGQLISQVGNWLTMVALALLVLDLTDNGLAVGILTACQFGPVLFLGAWAGLIADRSDKRKVLIVVQSVAMVQSFVLAALAFTGHPPLLAIYGVALIGGVTTAFDNPTRRSFVVELVSESELPNAVSLNSALMTSARIVGPALAGLLVATVGYGWCFVVDGVSYTAVIAGFLLMGTSLLRPSTPASRAKHQIRDGLRYARRTPDLWIPLVMMTIVGTFAFNTQVTMPLFVTRTFGQSEAIFTLLLSVISIGALGGALAMARRNEVGIHHVIVGSLIYGISMLMFALSPTLGVAFPLAILLGFTSMVFMVASTAIVQLRSEPAMRGRVLALQAIVFLGTTPIGGPVIGAICDAWGPRSGLALGGLSGLIAAAWGLHASGRLARRDELRSSPLPSSSMSSVTARVGSQAGSSG